MKKSISICFCVLLSGTLMFSCKPKDQDLQKSVQTVLSTTSKGVNSSVKDGILTLTGVVDSEEAKAVAEAAAKTVKDIKSVVNNIEVKAPVIETPAVTINADDTLKEIVNTGLVAGGFNGVVVNVQEGEVTLNGEAKRADLAKIMQIANEAKPKKVINNLKLN